MKISVKDVSREMKSNIILDNINLEFESGKIYGLCGHNGSGKTMLLRAIAGLIQIDHGEIMIDEKILHNTDFIDYIWMSSLSPRSGERGGILLF